MVAKYTYYLSFDGGASEVEFIPDKDAVYKWAKEKQYDGFMRKSIDKITFSKDYDNQGTLTNATPFNTLWEWYFDITKHTEEIKLLIYKDSVLDFESVFYVQDGDIDVGMGVYVIKPIIDDDYRIFLSVADDEVNIIQDSGSSEVRYLYLCVNEEVDNGSSTNPPTTLPAGSWHYRWEWEPHLWVRQQSQYDLDAYSGGVVGIKHEGLWYYPMPALNHSWYFPNCFTLIESIQYILDTILVGTSLAGMTLVSNFFNDETNYVTEETNYLMNTYIEQKSDTKDIDATDKATIGKISFNDLMKDLGIMFNIRWFIDGGNLRIEHEKFFYNGLSFGSKAVGIDLTNSGKYVADEADKYYIEDTQSFSGLTIDKVKTETITFLDQDTEDFRSELNYIEYDVVDFNVTKKNNDVAKFSTDVKKAIDNSGDIDDDGFYLFIVESGGFLSQRPYLFNDTDFVIGNGSLSVKWLIHDYYEYGRQSKSGTQEYSGSIHPGDLFSVIGTKPVYLQKDVIFLLNDSDTIDVNKYIRTYLVKSDGSKYNNDGNIEKIEHDLNTDFVKATLGYEL